MKFTLAKEQMSLIAKKTTDVSWAFKAADQLDLIKAPLSCALRLHNNGSTATELMEICNQICGSRDGRDSTPRSVLHHATETGDVAYAELLLDRNDLLSTEAKVDVNLPDDKGETPLHYAARLGGVPLNRALVQRGANIVAHSSCGDIPICLAIRGGHLPAVETLLELAARQSPCVCYFDIKSTTSLLTPAVGHPDMLRALLENCQKGCHSVPTGKLMPHLMSSGKVGAVEALLDAGADIEGRYAQDGSRPLHLAAKNANCDAIDTLLKRGAKVNVKDDMGRTPLHLVMSGNAGSERARKAIALLVAGGADEAAKDANGKTPAELPTRSRRAAMEPILARAQVERSWHQKVAVIKWRKQLERKLSDEGLHSLLSRLASLAEDELFQKVVGFL